LMNQTRWRPPRLNPRHKASKKKWSHDEHSKGHSRSCLRRDARVQTHSSRCPPLRVARCKLDPVWMSVTRYHLPSITHIN
jgi:hypothetical protein